MHKKLVLILFCFVMQLIAHSAVAQSIKLPNKSNVYPDTFAIYWSAERIRERDPNSKIAIKLSVHNLFGEEVIEIDECYDSIAAIPYYTNDVNEPDLIITASLVVNRRPGYGTRDDYQLKVIQINSKIEALIELINTNASPFNLLMLAEVYEREKCFVNAYYIFKKLTSINPTLGKNELDKFYQRNYRELIGFNKVSH